MSSISPDQLKGGVPVTAKGSGSPNPISKNGRHVRPFYEIS